MKQQNKGSLELRAWLIMAAVALLLIGIGLLLFVLSGTGVAGEYFADLSEVNLWEIEDSLYSDEIVTICGVDEAGRGPLAGPVCAAAVILGSEGFGVSRLLKDKSDYLISIPMYGSINSLNVSAAGAVILCEAAKQRHAVPK